LAFAPAFAGPLLLVGFRYGKLNRSFPSAANPKFAQQLPRVRLRTSGSKRH